MEQQDHSYDNSRALGTATQCWCRTTGSGTIGSMAKSPARRHPADYRDELEHIDVERILSELPLEHPARLAYATGAREAADSISLSWLVSDRRDLVQALVEANLAAWRRTLAQQAGLRP